MTHPDTKPEALRKLADEYRTSMGHAMLHAWAVDAVADIHDAADTIESLRTQLAEARAEAESLRAARIAYASEFPLSAEGEPDTGSIHANLRKLRAEAEALRADAERFQALIDTSPGCLCFMGRDYRSADEFRAAIDTAMGAKEGE